jgi:enamine deaminase RidA (YjgF/YER057c/UK114 family)
MTATVGTVVTSAPASGVQRGLSMYRSIIPALVAASLAACAAGGVAEHRTCFHDNEAVEKGIGYCQAVRSGNALYVSGSVGKGEMPVAMRQAYDDVKRTLQANGLDFRNVVRETLYTTDLDAVIRNKELRKDYYGSDLPAATWVQVQRLYSPALVVEVEVTAEYPAR